MLNRLVKLVVAILFWIGYKIYVLLCLARRRTAPAQLVILTYHPIKDSQTACFEKQMRILLDVGRPVTLRGDMSALRSGCNVAVTFDDAYQSVLKNAVPILLKKNIPATIFVPTGYLGVKPGWIRVHNHPYADEVVLTEAQLKTLPEDLITVGSHSVSHVSLNSVGESTARREIFQSKKTLEEILDRRITLFAAPYATLDKQLTPLFREAGYERVFLNIPTCPATNTASYVLGRTSVEPSDWPLEFRLKLMGAYQWLPLAISLKQKLFASSGL